MRERAEDVLRVALEILRIAPRAGGPARAQRVVYRIADEGLVRLASPASAALPVAPAEDPVELLPGARQLAVRTFAGGFWSVPGGAQPTVQPPLRATAIEVAVEAADGARYVRVFTL